MDRECLERKLDFHAPLLSTRRPGRIIVPREKWDLDSSSGFNDRVPFSWEQSPGKPKQLLSKQRTNIPPLKPPPIRLKDSSSSHEEGNHEDDGCDGDVDENDEEDFDFFSGGLDLFSLAESSDNQRKMGGGRKRAPPKTSFIMERFLPAAVALAVESLEATCTEYEETVERRALPAVTSPLGLKSCGLENLLPWRARPKKSVVKGPMKFGCSNWDIQLSPRPK